MSRFSSDVKYAVRTLGRKRGFSVVVVLTLGLGIGANTAFFSILNAVLIRPMGYPEADRLVVVNKALPERGVDRALFSPLDVLDVQRDQRSFEAAAFRNVLLEVSGGPAPELIDGAKVSADLFRVLRVDPLVGRTFSSSEDRPGERVVVLSWGLWQRRHQGNLSVVGQIMQPRSAALHSHRSHAGHLRVPTPWPPVQQPAG
jgi:putative ABC transport system permease protein